MGTPHKHRDMIIAWANGEEIEYWNDSFGEWREDERPLWYQYVKYRVKPKEIKIEGIVELKPGKCLFRPAEHWERENVEFIFDADTQKLVSVQIITN